jgi:hypothetical protein
MKLKELPDKKHHHYTLIFRTNVSYSHSTFRITSSGPFPIRNICKYGPYRQSVGLLEGGISPTARPLPTEGNMNTEETRRNTHASSGIRTHHHSV